MATGGKNWVHRSLTVAEAEAFCDHDYPAPPDCDCQKRKEAEALLCGEQSWSSEWQRKHLMRLGGWHPTQERIADCFLVCSLYTPEATTRKICEHRSLQGREQRQQQMMSFLAKAMQSPGFLAQFVQQNENSRRRIVAANKKRRLPKQGDGLDSESVSLDGQIIKYQPMINEAATAMLRKILQQDSSHRYESMGNSDNFLLENCMPTAQAFDSSSSTRNSAVTLAEIPGNSSIPYMAASSGLSAICSSSTPPEIQHPVLDNNLSKELPNMSDVPCVPTAMAPGPNDIGIPGFPDLHDIITEDVVGIPGGSFEMPGPECIFPLPEDGDDRHR
ncbi:hypothetical protein BRADI_1g01350v3 [Brachypodium distachyon]|uniref:Uncharacterized protein n=1 Tax=Brachypodium distachyon TaxID=15368 RepID=I1GKR7_BRADI|nr:hypothetical protein BRADI_1g01350v3 [Brachypodium distachyon]